MIIICLFSLEKNIIIWYNNHCISREAVKVSLYPISERTLFMEHSIRFPLPLSIHIGFVIVSIIVLILCYKRRKYPYELYMLIGIVSTMLVYLDESKLFLYILGLEEVILFIMTVVNMVKISKANAAAEKAAVCKNGSDVSDTVETADDDTDENNDFTE